MKRVLIIDDEPVILVMLKKMIEKAGYKVDLASNGNEGLELLRGKPFDLVITDIIMPEKEGLEIISIMRKEFPAIKIIAISGGGRLSPDGYLESANLLGAKKVLKKPFTMDEIVGAVNELLT
ncbi:MAG: response regulator [Bacteroidales bacterium]|nr:response regulator [Bacteroidales bacterium]